MPVMVATPGPAGYRRFLPVVGITAMAAALRFSTLGAQSLWADEALTASIARGDLRDALIPGEEAIPPLSYVLTWGWTMVFGDSAEALRALPALLGTLTVPAAYVAGVVVRSRRVGLITAALVAVAPILVWYSQEARTYALYTLVSLLAFIAFVRALQLPHDRRPLVAWGLLSAVALASHYFAAFVIAAELGWLLLRHPMRRRVLAAAGPAAITGVVLLPLLLHQLEHAPRPWTDRYSVQDQALAVGQQFLVGIKWTPLIHRGGVALLGLLALAAAARLLRSDAARERRAAAAPLIVGAAALALPLALALVGPNYVTARNVLGAWVPLAIVVALGASAGPSGRFGAALTSAFGALSIAIVVATASDARLQRDDWKTLLAPLGPPRSERLIAVIDAPTNEAVVRYYRPRAAVAPRTKATPEVAVVGGRNEFVAPPHGEMRTVERRSLGRLGFARYEAPWPVQLPERPYARTDMVILAER